MDSKIIAAFSTSSKSWRRIGELNAARAYHGVLLHDGAFIVVGGCNRKCFIERCTITYGSKPCENISPRLEKSYRYDSTMMSVPYDYCPV